ncbi:AEC family transporter [Yaniella flava]|uniref:AEC family transporter n=1 Tax=Yaniella flava TaxID=287930 RepID=A0ABP5GD37_9MICC
MLEALAVLAPMFLIFGIGYFAGYSQRFKHGAAGLNNFVFSIALPCFIYISIATAELPDAFPWQVWVLAFVFPAVFAVVVYYATRWLAPKHADQAAPLSMSASYGNVGYFGIPMTIALLGPEAAVPAAIVHLLHNLVFLIGYPVLRGDSDQDHSKGTENQRHQNTLQRLGREVVSRALLSPVTISTVLGVAVVALNIPVPDIITGSIELMGATAIPLALFSVGIAMHPALASLRSGGLSIALVLSGIGLKNVIFPLATLGLAWVFRDDMGTGWFGTVLLMAAMPMSTSGYILSERYDESGDMAAAILAGTTLLSIVTVPVAAALLG